MALTVQIGQSHWCKDKVERESPIRTDCHTLAIKCQLFIILGHERLGSTLSLPLWGARAKTKIGSLRLEHNSEGGRRGNGGFRKPQTDYWSKCSFRGHGVPIISEPR